MSCMRPAILADAGSLPAIPNAIVETGSTTAIGAPLDSRTDLPRFLRGPAHTCCLAAAQDREALRFQALEAQPSQSPDWANIAPFTRQRDRVPGVGRRLLEATRMQPVGRGIRALGATIRADSACELAYDDALASAIPLASDRPIDRISKRLFLARGA